MSDTPSARELQQTAYDNWHTIPRGIDEETLRDIGYDTPDSLPATVARVRRAGAEAVRPAAQLKEVDEDYVASKGARREATLREGIANPKTSRELLAADQPPEKEKVTPQGHDYYWTVHEGGRR